MNISFTEKKKSVKRVSHLLHEQPSFSSLQSWVSRFLVSLITFFVRFSFLNKCLNMSRRLQYNYCAVAVQILWERARERREQMKEKRGGD